MNTTRPAVGIFVCCALVLSTSALLAADWPQWAGPQRNSTITGFQAPQTWPKELNKKWQQTVGTGDSTPALVGDKLYVFTRMGAEEVLSCLDANNGKPLWQEKYAPGVTVTGAAGSHPGPRSSPAVADGKVVTLGVNEILSCFDASNGRMIWRKEFSKDYPQPYPRFFAATSPLIVNGLCIAQIGGQGKGSIMAFDLNTGDVKWKAESGGPAYASPVLMKVDETESVVAQTEKSLMAVSLADGKKLWEVPAATQRMAQNAASPVIEGNTVIYTGQGQGTRAITIEKQGDNYSTKELWTNSQIGASFNTPVLKDGALYGLNDRGNFYCMDAKTGKTLWTDSTSHGRGFGSIVDAGPVLIALTQKAELIAMKPDKSAFSKLAQYTVSDSETYAYPVVSGNRIFIKDKENVKAYSLE